MNTFQEIWFLFKKELTLEFRQKYAISGILLYIFSTIFVVYTSAISVGPKEWNVLFWIIILFASVNAVAKSFVQESGGRQLYYYTLVNPIAIIISKMLYNTLLLLLLSFLAYGIFSLVIGSPVRDNNLFFLAIFLASLGFSITFTFISAIASKANNSASLMAILGFPIIIPILMTLVKISSNALALMQDSSIDKDIMILLSIDLLMAGAALLLFPFLWRD
ncbi:MAG TPA: ABC transporter permease [Phaeodactylibacter sp.]|nr:ABC transporter permease [Phaeodactylibacter sp.]